MPLNSDRRLYQPSELPGVLQLSQEQIDWLVNTGQLSPIFIAGEQRFDSRDINQLIAAYKAVQSRRSH